MALLEVVAAWTAYEDKQDSVADCCRFAAAYVCQVDAVAEYEKPGAKIAHLL